MFYRYYRFRTTKRRDAGITNDLQIAEFAILNGGTRVYATTVTAPGGSSPGGEGPEKADDNNTATKWLDFNGGSPLVYDYGTATGATGYYITTANDAPERDPVRWAVEGSNDNTNWTILDDQTAADYPTPTDRFTSTPTINFPGGGPVTVDLTAASLGFSAKTNQNLARTSHTTTLLNWSAKAIQNQSRISLTAGLFDWSTQPVQNRANVTTTVGQLTTSAQPVQNSLRAEQTQGLFDWDSKPVQNVQIATQTAATFSWSAKAITFVTGVATVVFDLLAATFNWSAKSVQNLARTSHTGATLNWSAKAIQNILTTPLTLATLSWSAKTIQNRATATMTAAQLKWQGLPINPTRIIALSAALWASWSAKTLQNRLTIALTQAVLNLQPLQVNIVTDAIVVVAKRFKSRLSRYRQLLKQRRY